jgi:hypothetical protein
LAVGLLVLDSSAVPALAAEASAVPAFRAVEIDPKVEIGYGLAIADVDGDGHPDILLADKKQFVWYRNPGWERFVMAENLTPLDNVCVAAQDLDGDGKAEVAVGAEWNPGDTVNSGAVFYLIPPKDRTQRWEAVKLHHEPTVHRMRWVRNGAGRYELVVAPLHGRGNQGGAGEGAKILSYQMPANPHESWKTSVVSDTLHMTHNLDPINWTGQTGQELLVASKEGLFHLVPGPSDWKSQALARTGEQGFNGAGEVRAGKLPGGGRFVVAIEPMHGNQVVIYTLPSSGGPGALWTRKVIDDSVKEGHSLACGDLLGCGSDQVVMGWRTKNAAGKVGLKLFVPLDREGQTWSQSVVDDDTMACEDLRLADLNGDGRLDIVAAGRATHNLKIYFNLGVAEAPARKSDAGAQTK